MTTYMIDPGDWESATGESVDGDVMVRKVSDGDSGATNGTVIGLDSAISFDLGVDCLFYSKMLITAAKYWKAQNKAVSVPSAEALRRAIALIEAIFTDKVTVKESR